MMDFRTWNIQSIIQNPISFPSGFDAVRQYQSGRLDFVDFSVPDFEDVHRRHVENTLIGRHIYTVDFRRFELAVVIQIRKTYRQPLLFVDDQQTAIADFADIGENAC